MKEQPGLTKEDFPNIYACKSSKAEYNCFYAGY
jgi:hypothetical protein